MENSYGLLFSIKVVKHVSRGSIPLNAQIFIKKRKLDAKSLTLFYTGGGPADPPWRYISRDASVDGPMELKFHDFVSFYICYVPLRPLFKKNFWKFEKSQKFFSIVPTSKGPPSEKKILKIFFSNFFAINHTFSIWIWNLHVLSFLLMYITYTFIKILRNFAKNDAIGLIISSPIAIWWGKE